MFRVEEIGIGWIKELQKFNWDVAYEDQRVMKLIDFNLISVIMNCCFFFAQYHSEHVFVLVSKFNFLFDLYESIPMKMIHKKS